MLKIRNIRTDELLAFIDSEEFRQMEHIPISPLRAVSHASNPRASADDNILFLAYDDEKLIGYLGALPDIFYVAGESFKVAWLSCMWVDMEWRRHGIAHKLLVHADETWKSNLLISNFIPSSKAVFDKTGLFGHFKNLEGIRGYLRFNLAEILVGKKPALQKISGLLKCADLILNIFNELRFFFHVKKGSTVNCRFLSLLDEEAENFLMLHNQMHLSRKNKKDFNWMKEYPWIFETKNPDRDALRYEFSSVDRKFKQHFLLFYDSHNRPVGLMMISQRGNHLKTPFVYMDNGNEQEILHYLCAFMIHEKVRTFTTYHPVLSSLIKTGRHPFIKTRCMVMESIITPKLKGKFGNVDNYYLQDGDGDAAFT